MSVLQKGVGEGRGAREFQVTQSIVFLFIGYVIKQFRLHESKLLHSKMIFKGKKRKPTTNTA